MKAPKYEKAISPKGIAVYPHLNKPDTKWKPEGEFKVTLRIAGGEAEAFKSAIEERVSKALEEAKKELLEKAAGDGKKLAQAKRVIEELKVLSPVKPAYDDDGNETGDIEVAFKTKATVTDRKTGATIQKKLPLFDAKRQPMGENVWGGSQLKVAFEYMPYYNPATKQVGVSLRMNAVQVIELVSSSSAGNGNSFGFGEEEGFVAADKQEQEHGDTDANFASEELEGNF